MCDCTDLGRIYEFIASKRKSDEDGVMGFGFLKFFCWRRFFSTAPLIHCILLLDHFQAWRIGSVRRIMEMAKIEGIC